MKIGFTGTISAGKTTLVKALSELSQFKDYHIAVERSKYLRDLGIPLNTDSTLKEHMPLEHQYQYEKWNSRRILNWANSIGKNTSLLMQQIMDSKGHEARAYKSCIAILSFSNTYGKEEIEKVSKVALEANILKVSLIEAMLKTKSYLYYYTQEKSVNNSYLNDHENIRGGLYYAKSDI